MTFLYLPKRILWIVIFCTITAKCLSQTHIPSQWEKTMGGSASDECFSLSATDDGGYILGGQTSSGNGDVTNYHGLGDFWIVKLSAQHTIEWQKCLGGSDNEIFGSIATTPDGGYVAVGSTFSTDGDVAGNHGSSDFFVVKLTADGGIAWKKCFGGTSGDRPTSIAVDRDSNYVIAGLTMSNDDQVAGNHGSADAWLIKVSVTGNLLWQKCVGGSGYEAARIVKVLPDGYLLTGETSSPADGDFAGTTIHGSNSDAFVIKLGWGRDIQWVKRLGGSAYENFSSVQITPDNDILLAGATFSTDGDNSSNHGGSDGWFVKLGVAGDMRWSRCFGTAYDEAFTSVLITKDGKYLVSGNSSEYLTDATDQSVNFIEKIDTNGVEMQKNRFGTKSDAVSAMILLQNNDLALAGYYNSSGDIYNNDYTKSDFWISELAAASILPLQVLNFQGAFTKQAVRLTWETADEAKNIAFFDVERSFDGVHFQTIGQVTARVNNPAGGYYYTDEPEQAISATFYYRLKEINKDQNGYYSKIIQLTGSTPGLTVECTPNPVNDFLYIKPSVGLPGAIVSVTDADGRAILLQRVDLVGGANTGIVFSGVAKGVYFVQVNTAGVHITKKIIKQ
ncbi:MAG TPA: T9SS type A sorting domain-containing protein [Chitinophagaceae bacterium]|nr:T9SS type A sorting domain-containing protein [Chitinophagaceae bacterium]